MKRRRREFEENREYNPVLWSISKHLFALRRYGVTVALVASAAGVYYLLQTTTLPQWVTLLAIAPLVLLALSLRVAFEWERVPVMRLGRFVGTRGPGVFFVIPVIDTIYGYVDCRIMVTDFSAEKVLTKDAVPIFVDAIIFWMIWDAGKARLEVENFENAVPLSAKTALRDIIGKTSLARLLTDRDEIGQELRKILDAKTNPWGITALSVEIKDIVVPRELEDAISREAQAEREKNARIILGSAEVELSRKYAEASEKYKGNEEALSLRSMNLLLDAVKNKGNMILVPSETPHLMNKAMVVALGRRSIPAEESSDDASG